MIPIDVKNGTPIYEQIVSGLKQLIITGVFKGDEKIPSVRELGRRLTINPNTIQKAYRELERQGYIYTVVGKGNFVSPRMIEQDLMKINEIKERVKKDMAELKYLGSEKSEILMIVDSVYGEGATV